MEAGAHGAALAQDGTEPSTCVGTYGGAAPPTPGDWGVPVGAPPPSRGAARVGTRGALLRAFLLMQERLGPTNAPLAVQVAREVLRRRGCPAQVHVGFTRHPRDLPGQGFSHLTAWVTTPEGVTDLLCTPGALRAVHVLGRSVSVALPPAELQKVVTQGEYGEGGASWVPYTPTFHGDPQGGHVPNVLEDGTEAPLAAKRALLVAHATMSWRRYTGGAPGALGEDLQALVDAAVQEGGTMTAEVCAQEAAVAAAAADGGASAGAAVVSAAQAVPAAVPGGGAVPGAAAGSCAAGEGGPGEPTAAARARPSARASLADDVPHHATEHARDTAAAQPAPTQSGAGAPGDALGEADSESELSDDYD